MVGRELAKGEKDENVVLEFRLIPARCPHVWISTNRKDAAMDAAWRKSTDGAHAVQRRKRSGLSRIPPLRTPRPI